MGYQISRYAHINAAATTVVQGAHCRLFTVTVNKGVAAATIEIHDCVDAPSVNAGNLIALIDASAANTFQYGTVDGVQLVNGLVVVAGSTADATVAWG
jgi:hypothetical protein